MRVLDVLGWIIAGIIGMLFFWRRDAGQVEVEPGKVEKPPVPQDDSGTLTREEIERLMEEARK